MQTEAGDDPTQSELEQVPRDNKKQHGTKRQAKPLDETSLSGIAVQIVAAVNDDD